MARYIDANDVLKHKRKMRGFGISPEDDFWDYAVLVEDIQKTPTADVEEVKHGKWVDVYKGKYHNQLYVCSICGAKALYKFEVNELGNERAVQDLSLGCHHCRAKMDGGKTE